MARSSEESNDHAEYDEVVDLLMEVVKFLDHMGKCFAMCDTDALCKAAFVWEQRRDHILKGDETFAHQNLGEPTWLGRTDVQG